MAGYPFNPDLDPFAYDGWVTANDDPEGRHRVKIRVPGILEPESGWALPWATIGGGSEGRGGHLTPGVGANVGVMFAGGDRDQPRYICGYWPKGKEPDNHEGGDPDVFAFALGGVRFKLSKGIVDESFPNGRGYGSLSVLPGGGVTSVEVDGGTNTSSVGGARAVVVVTMGKFAVKANVGEIMGRAIMKMARFL